MEKPSKTSLIIIGIAFVGILLSACDSGESPEILGEKGTYCGKDTITEPVMIVRENGKPQEVSFDFPKIGRSVCLYVGSVYEKAPASADISINGVEFLKESEFSAKFTGTLKPIPFDLMNSEKNTVTVNVRGKPGTALWVSVRADMSFDRVSISPELGFQMMQKENLLSVPNVEMDLVLVFKEWMTPSEVEEFLKDEKAPIPHLVGMHYHTHNTFYDTYVRKYPIDFSQLLQEISKEEFSAKDATEDLQNNITGEEVIKIDHIEGKGLPLDTYDLWMRNPEKIRFVHTIQKGIDRGVYLYSPDEEVR